LEKNPRFTAFLDSNLHTRLALVTENELGLAFPPRNLPKKLRPDPSTFYLVIVVTDRQTDGQTNRQTNAGDYIIPRESFRGDNKTQVQIEKKKGKYGIEYSLASASDGPCPHGRGSTLKMESPHLRFSTLTTG